MYDKQLSRWSRVSVSISLSFSPPSCLPRRASSLVSVILDPLLYDLHPVAPSPYLSRPYYLLFRIYLLLLSVLCLLYDPLRLVLLTPCMVLSCWISWDPRSPRNYSIPFTQNFFTAGVPQAD